MSYKITYSYNWYQTSQDKFIIKTYYFNYIPFTFDALEEEQQNDPEIVSNANQNLIMKPEIFYQKSFYLIDEEAHPCLFSLDLENPEILDEIL